MTGLRWLLAVGLLALETVSATAGAEADPRLAAQSDKQAATALHTKAAATEPAGIIPGRFVDVTEKSGVHFLHQAPHTSRKYLIETMGSGVGLFDCDGDGRLDLYMVNGAPYADPEPKGSIPQKTGPEFWNRMYHQKADGTFEDITEKSGLKGVGLRNGRGRGRL